MRTAKVIALTERFTTVTLSVLVVVVVVVVVDVFVGITPRARLCGVSLSKNQCVFKNCVPVEAITPLFTEIALSPKRYRCFLS